MKIIGFIPARMASSRFPGKPLHPICGMPMLEHVIHRARMYENWDGLFLTTGDKEIHDFAKTLNISTIMTSNRHKRALDRITEAVQKCGIQVNKNDIIVNVQGDEPMMHPEMIEASIKPMLEDENVNGTVLGMHIVNKEDYLDPNNLKIIHNKKGDILYTSRSPIPYSEKFSPELNARRIYGIFGFKWHFLEKFSNMKESPLEIVESCDSNRLYDNGYTQRLSPFPYVKSFAVDSPKDIERVEDHMDDDPYYSLYKKK